MRPLAARKRHGSARFGSRSRRERILEPTAQNYLPQITARGAKRMSGLELRLAPCFRQSLAGKRKIRRLPRLTDAARHRTVEQAIANSPAYD